jgi:hypothetical protein
MTLFVSSFDIASFYLFLDCLNFTTYETQVVFYILIIPVCCFLF